MILAGFSNSMFLLVGQSVMLGLVIIGVGLGLAWVCGLFSW
jgi:hypothetical protein